MQEFFIEWAQNNKTKQINFYTLTDFNYILQNSNTVQEMQHQLAQYSKKWTPPKSESKSIFQSILN